MPKSMLEGPNPTLFLAPALAVLLAASGALASCGSSPADPVADRDATADARTEDAGVDPDSGGGPDAEDPPDTDPPRDTGGDTGGDTVPPRDTGGDTGGDTGDTDPPRDTGGDPSDDTADLPPDDCPDPNAPGVSYVGTSPEECADIDFDCFGARSFDGPCGCGCLSCPDRESPAVTYVSDDPSVCAVIDYACPEPLVGWGDETCGCGCILGSEHACDATKFRGTSGMAESFALDARCEFLVACSDGLLADGLADAFRGHYADARCGDGTTWGCPDGTRSFCEAFVDVVDPVDLVAGCAISAAPSVDAVLCGGDL